MNTILLDWAETKTTMWCAKHVADDITISAIFRLIIEKEMKKLFNAQIYCSKLLILLGVSQIMDIIEVKVV